jgi:hypothetical protein
MQQLKQTLLLFTADSVSAEIKRHSSLADYKPRSFFFILYDISSLSYLLQNKMKSMSVKPEPMQILPIEN